MDLKPSHFQRVCGGLGDAATRGGKNTHTHGYPLVKSFTGMGQVAKRVYTSIINGYLTTYYYMDTDTDLMVHIPAGTHTR